MNQAFAALAHHHPLAGEQNGSGTCAAAVSADTASITPLEWDGSGDARHNMHLLVQKALQFALHLVLKERMGLSRGLPPDGDRLIHMMFKANILKLTPEARMKTTQNKLAADNRMLVNMNVLEVALKNAKRDSAAQEANLRIAMEAHSKTMEAWTNRLPQGRNKRRSSAAAAVRAARKLVADAMPLEEMPHKKKHKTAPGHKAVCTLPQLISEAMVQRESLLRQPLVPAKAALQQHQVAFESIDLTNDTEDEDAAAEPSSLAEQIQQQQRVVSTTAASQQPVTRTTVAAAAHSVRSNKRARDSQEPCNVDYQASTTAAAGGGGGAAAAARQPAAAAAALSTAVLSNDADHNSEPDNDPEDDHDLVGDESGRQSKRARCSEHSESVVTDDDADQAVDAEDAEDANDADQADEDAHTDPHHDDATDAEPSGHHGKELMTTHQQHSPAVAAEAEAGTEVDTEAAAREAASTAVECTGSAATPVTATGAQPQRGNRCLQAAAGGGEASTAAARAAVAAAQGEGAAVGYVRTAAAAAAAAAAANDDDQQGQPDGFADQTEESGAEPAAGVQSVQQCDENHQLSPADEQHQSQFRDEVMQCRTVADTEQHSRQQQQQQQKEAAPEVPICSQQQVSPPMQQQTPAVLQDNAVDTAVACADNSTTVEVQHVPEAQAPVTASPARVTNVVKSATSEIAASEAAIAKDTTAATGAGTTRAVTAIAASATAAADGDAVKCVNPAAAGGAMAATHPVAAAGTATATAALGGTAPACTVTAGAGSAGVGAVVVPNVDGRLCVLYAPRNPQTAQQPGGCNNAQSAARHRVAPTAQQSPRNQLLAVLRAALTAVSEESIIAQKVHCRLNQEVSRVARVLAKVPNIAPQFTPVLASLGDAQRVVQDHATAAAEVGAAAARQIIATDNLLRLEAETRGCNSTAAAGDRTRATASTDEELRLQVQRLRALSTVIHQAALAQQNLQQGLDTLSAALGQETSYQAHTIPQLIEALRCRAHLADESISNGAQAAKQICQLAETCTQTAAAAR